MKTAKLYLGIDWGDAKIGVAIGDDQSKTAVPLAVVKDFEELREIINNESINIVVLGQPVKLSGDKSFLDAFNDFEDKLRGLNLPVELIDERLTSVMADKLSGGRKDKAEQDAIAAMLILQSYFDKEN
ncbi:MAG: Holliday junction resolvase RuvX [bacterium]